jgi:hypothetical protein
MRAHRRSRDGRLWPAVGAESLHFVLKEKLAAGLRNDAAPAK